MDLLNHATETRIEDAEETRLQETRTHKAP
jgi:hypothetical protein